MMSNRRAFILSLAGLAASAAAAAAQTPPKPSTGTAAAPKKPRKVAAAKKPAVKKAAVKKVKPQPRLVILISKPAQKMTVTLDGATKYRWDVSTGARGYDTPSGSYRPFRLEKEHFSKEWDDAPMPHSIFFTARGHAVHGSFHVKSLGQRASHGCVRLHPDNAAKLFALVGQTGMSNTRVVVKGGFFDGGGFRGDADGGGGRKLFPWLNRG